jgi:glycosyltransferase involved in cell wall biosynthesis
MIKGLRVAIARSNPVAPDPRVEKTARALASAGALVSVIAWDRVGDLPRFEDRSFAVVNRLRILAGFGRGIRNLPALLRWEVGLLAWLWQNRATYDIIHACDFDTILPALLARGLWRKLVIYDVFDYYAEMLRATPSLLKQWIRSVDQWAMGTADALILADDSRLDQIKGARPRRLEIVFNSPEDVLSQTNPSLLRRPDRSELHIAFVGLLQLERGLLQLLEVLSHHPEWTMDLAGFGGDESKISDRAKQLGNVQVHGRVPYETALELTRVADVLVATYDPQIPNHRYASPNKLFEAMMLAKPIIVAEGTSMDRIVAQAGCGLVVPYGVVPALDRALTTLAGDGNLRMRLGVAGRRAYEETYGWVHMSKRLVRLYDELTS